ncbi:MAG: hypothetical protein KDD61_16895, partial [Bdellovibrionales bacterium]|nr:hypothetical protein [Bdellovibrionales bacterium]
QSSLALVSFTQSQWRLVIQFLQRNGVERILPIAGVKIIHKNQVRSKEREDHWVYSFVGQQEWTLLFFIRSEKKLHGSVLKQFQLQLRAIGLKKRDFSLKKINLYIWILRIIPLSFLEDLASAMENLREFYYLGDGRPSSVGHQVRNKSQGLVWLSPLCPLKEDRVHDLLQIVMSWNSSPILFSSTWTWTQLNQRTLALVIPLQFDKKTPQADVWKDYRAKLDLLKAKGFAPYRLPIECMDHFTNSIAPKHFELIRKVTRALNPEDNLSAGRYF